MILFAHTKFGLVRIQGSRVKRGAESAPPRSERVFQIPVQIGLNCLTVNPGIKWTPDSDFAPKIILT